MGEVARDVSPESVDRDFDRIEKLLQRQFFGNMVSEDLVLLSRYRDRGFLRERAFRFYWKFDLTQTKGGA